MVVVHGSCFGLYFFQYICDKNHKWTFVFVVPYETSLCQVGVSEKQNGTLKIYIFFKANNEILTFRIENMIGEMELLPTAIIPILNKTWEKTFTEV